MKMEDNIEEMELRPSNLLRTFTLRNNAARQVVNFMPSRQIGYNTIRLRRSNSSRNALLDEMCDEAMDTPDTTDKHADNIVREMQQNHHLMEDHPLSEELRREALRDLPQGLTMKRNVRAKLSASVSLRSKRRPISTFKRIKYRISFTWKRTRERFREFFSSIELWYEAIRNIEGHLGSAVGTYFHLLRWLFSLNLLLMVFLVCFVVVPQALYDKAHANGSMELSVWDFITGEGGLTDSLLFYGHYHNGTINTVGSLNYYMPNAYFFTMFSLYLIVFAVLCYRTAYSYRRHFIEPAGDDAAGRPLLAGKLFCAWDHATASPAAAARHAHALYHEFKEILEEQNSKLITESWSSKLLRRLANIVVTMLALGFIAGFEYGLWLLLDLEMDNKEIYISLLITAVAAIYPVILNFVVNLRGGGGGRGALQVCVSRAAALPVLTSLLLLLHWQRAGQRGEHCWETRVGQECYRLVMLDAVVSLLLLPAFEVIRGLLYKCDLTGPPQFDIAYNSLTLIFNQAVLWVGMLFSPLLVAAVTLKFLLLFYVKKETALRTCQTGKKVWRAAQTHTVLLLLVCVSLFVSLVSLAALFVRGSSRCGSLSVFSPVSSALSPRAARARSVLQLAARPASVAFMLLALCACVYMVRARSLARASCARELRRLRRLHARDRDFLLGAIRKVADGEWLYSPKSEESGEDSHTWKYLHEVRKPSNAGYHFDASRLSHSFADRPKSYVRDNRPTSYHTDRQKSNDDGDTDSSFSWQGSSSKLNKNSGTP